VTKVGVFIESDAGQKVLAGLFVALGIALTVWGLWLAVVVPGDARAGEGWDPGFIRGLGIFMAILGPLVVVSAGVAWRRVSSKRLT
jgi:hypothetical protein